MKKTNVSIGSLVNLKKLDALIKKADVLIVGREGGMTYICNSHWIVRSRLPEGCSTLTAIFARLGRMPEDGCAIQTRGNNNVSEFDLDNLKKFFSSTFYTQCHDTRLTEVFDSYELRILLYADEGKHCYAAIDRRYFDMINEYARAASQKCAKSSPVLFTGNYDEAALILPVNYTPCAFLK